MKTALCNLFPVTSVLNKLKQAFHREIISNFKHREMKKPKYILIAEDDEDDQFLLISAFKEISEDFELIFVENGIELLDHFEKFDRGSIDSLPALLVVDLNMPKKNGKEAIKELLDKNYFRSFPTIIFSTTGNELEKTRCKELGINDFFVKPSNYDSLLSLVTQFKEMAV